MFRLAISSVASGVGFPAEHWIEHEVQADSGVSEVEEKQALPGNA